MIKSIFTMANMNSSSPYTDTKNMLLSKSKEPNRVIHTAWFMGVQKSIIIAHATISAGNSMAVA